MFHVLFIHTYICSIYMWKQMNFDFDVRNVSVCVYVCVCTYTHTHTHTHTYIMQRTHSVTIRNASHDGLPRGIQRDQCRRPSHLQAPPQSLPQLLLPSSHNLAVVGRRERWRRGKVGSKWVGRRQRKWWWWRRTHAGVHGNCCSDDFVC